MIKQAIDEATDFWLSNPNGAVRSCYKRLRKRGLSLSSNEIRDIRDSVKEIKGLNTPSKESDRSDHPKKRPIWVSERAHHFLTGVVAGIEARTGVSTSIADALDVFLDTKEVASQK